MVKGVNSTQCAENISNDRKNGVIYSDKDSLTGESLWVINANKLAETSPKHLPMTKEDLASRYCKDESQIFNFNSTGQSSEATSKVMNGKYFMKDDEN